MPDHCLTENCKGEVRFRGLCYRCYQLAAKAVREKRITWEQLENHNPPLAIPVQGGPRSPMGRAIARLETEAE